MRKHDQIALVCDVAGCSQVASFNRPGPFGGKELAGWVRIELWLGGNRGSVLKGVDICPEHIKASVSWDAFQSYVMGVFENQRQQELQEEMARRPPPTPRPTEGVPDSLGP